MINIKPIAIGAAILAILLFATVEVDSWWTARRVSTNDAIAQRDRGIAARDAAIRARDRRVDSLRVADSLLNVHAQSLASKLAVATTAWARAKAALPPAEAVPAPVVRALVLTGDSALVACRAVVAVDEMRVADLLDAAAIRDTTRADLNANRAAGDTTRAALVAIARPPLVARILAWVSDHAVTLVAGGAVGFVLGRK